MNDTVDFSERHRPIALPPLIPYAAYRDAQTAVERLVEIYRRNTAFIRSAFAEYVAGKLPLGRRVRACYPAVRIRTHSYQEVDSRLSYGHLVAPGAYMTTVTQPDLYFDYLKEQLGLLIKNHGVPVEVGESDVPVPLHFAFPDGRYVESGHMGAFGDTLRDHFDVPSLKVTDDAIVNCTWKGRRNEPRPLALFTAPRVDYSLHRLRHYTATEPRYFQNFVLFTNYQFYIDAFCQWARETLAQSEGGYTALIEPGNVVTPRGADGERDGPPLARLPQMPTYHLVRENHSGITMINIGVGPSNAKTITDHVAVLRPSAWLMLGHCAGLRTTQKLGDYVLAHGYVRDDHVLDADLPLWVPLPPLAEVQVALERAVAEVAGLSGWELKKIMRTGTVATIDNRNWELRDHAEQVQRFSQSRAIALDMESATIAANGFRFRVPYGTLLCVSDKPLHGELKLPGMASEFYRTQVARHLHIGIRALENLRDMPRERLHSRKLRSFVETAFK